MEPGRLPTLEHLSNQRQAFEMLNLHPHVLHCEHLKLFFRRKTVLLGNLIGSLLCLSPHAQPVGDVVLFDAPLKSRNPSTASMPTDDHALDL